MSDQFTNPAAHTRVPNIVQDIIIPLVSLPERECLHYIIRHTFGYATPDGNRKARDTISLDQFENGISSGNFLLDLGTQMTKNTIKKALAELEDKGIVDMRYSCVKCFWEPDEGQVFPDDAGRPGCERCGRTLAISYALAALTPRKVCALLNQYDKQKRKWSYNSDHKRFVWEPGSEERRSKQKNQDELRKEGITIYRKLWYPKKVDEAIQLAELQLKAGRKITLTRRINNFYRRALDLQEKYDNPALIEYALNQTLGSKALRQPDTHSWYKYADKVCENNVVKFTGVVPTDTNEAVQIAQSPEAIERTARGFLEEAAKANNAKEPEKAKAVLEENLIPLVPQLAQFFDGDAEQTEKHIKEAFKQGSSDFIGIRPNPYGINYLPEFEWDGESSSV